MLPCSFDQDHRHGVSLQEYSIEQAWNSPAFDAFRLKLKTNCTGCEKRQDCMGGCPLLPEIVLCNEKPIYHKNQGGKQ